MHYNYEPFLLDLKDATSLAQLEPLSEVFEEEEESDDGLNMKTIEKKSDETNKVSNVLPINSSRSNSSSNKPNT